MEMEKFYVSPVVEVLEVAIEKGYSASVDGGGQGGYNPDEDYVIG